MAMIPLHFHWLLAWRAFDGGVEGDRGGDASFLVCSWGGRAVLLLTASDFVLILCGVLSLIWIGSSGRVSFLL